MSSGTPLQRILTKNFHEILKERKYIKSEEITDKLQRALVLLKGDNENLRDNEQLIHPLALIIASPSSVPPKAISLALSCIQQLLIQNMISNDHTLTDLTESMIHVLYSEDYSLSISDDHSNYVLRDDEENLHLKILQINLMIISNAKINFNQNLFAKLLALFFRMHRTKNVNVTQTASVAIQQTTNLIFDTLAKADQSTEDDTSLSSNTFATAKSAYLFFSDLCLLAQKNEARWLKLKNADQCFVLELLEDILTQFSQVILKYDDFVALLREKISQILIKQLQNNEIRFPLTLRLFRVASALSRLLYVEKLQNGCFDYLDYLTEMTREDSVPLWKKVLALEVFRQICSDHALLKKTFEQVHNIQQPNNLLNKICSSVRFCVEKLLNSETSAVGSHFQHAANQYRRLDTCISSSTPFQSSPDECLTICIDCLMGIIQSMSILAVLNTGEELAENDEIVRSRETCSNMVESVWCPVLVSLSALLEHCHEPDTINTVLRAYLLFTDSCSVSGKYTARDAFLTNICKFAPSLPKQNGSVALGGNSGPQHNSPSGTSEEFVHLALSKKNILVAQTIVDIAQSIGENLGKSWHIVLQAFINLNDVIIDYQKNSLLNASSFASDVKNITKSMDSLMQSTKKYSDEHLSDLIESLCNLSKAELQHELGTGHMFAAAQSVIILKLNISRIHVVWDIVQPHMLSLIEHEDPLVRQQGIQDIFELIHEFFSPQNTMVAGAGEGESPATSTPAPFPQAVDTTRKDNVELDIFTLLLTISSSMHADSKQEMIEALTIVIEQYGELISSAWTIILTVLRSIENNSKLVPLAFKSVQLIGSNIQYLTPDGLIEYMKTVQFFALQQCVEDFNISLVAISLLWNLSDFMVKSDFGERKMELFITLFTTLRKSVVDPRPEVRNAAVRTLLFAVASQGAELDTAAWESVVQKVLIPVLRDMQNCAENADQTVVNYTVSKQQKKMYVHHSRNTEAKQWSETNSLAIENISRVLKEHWAKLEAVPDFVTEGCNVITSFIISSFQIQTSEIARIIITSMFDVFASTRGAIQRALWDGLWPLWASMVEAACEGQKFVSNNLLTQLVQSFTTLYNSEEQREFLTHDDLHALAMLMKDVLLSKCATNMVSHPSPCQKSVLVLFKDVSHYSDEMCLEIFNILIDLLPSEDDIRQCVLKKKEASDLPHVNVASAILATLVDDVFNEASSIIRRQVFLRVIRRLGHMMKTKFIPHFEYELWRPAIMSFNSVVRNTLDEFNKVSQVEAEAMWSSLCISMEEFLFQQPAKILSGGVKIGSDKSQSEETVLVTLIDTVILPSSKSASNHLKRRLLSILEKASRTAPRAIAPESMRCLFRVVALASEYLKMRDNEEQPQDEDEGTLGFDASSEEMDIMVDVGLCAVPILFQRCKEIITKYIADDELSGEMPLPSFRRQEVINIFQQLKEHDLHHRLCIQIPTDNTRLSEEVLNGPKGILVRLFPQLCQFTRSSIQDPSLKNLLCDILSILSREFGF